MHRNVATEVAALRRMTTGQLRHRYAEAFGETTNANNKAWLVKRIAWRLQALAEGDLSERARHVRGQVHQVHDLADAGAGDVAQPGQRGVVGYHAGAHQVVQAKGQGHQAADAGHTPRGQRWLRLA